jgi:acetyl esterase
MAFGIRPAYYNPVQSSRGAAGMNDRPAVLPLDAGMLRFYKELTLASPPEAVNWPLPRQRRSWEEVCRVFRAPMPPDISFEDVTIIENGREARVRVYRHQSEMAKPAVIYMHGGGWVLGSLETHHDICAEIAAEADVTVVAVDYRLAPEHPHPAQLEDNLAVLDWLRREGATFGIDGGRIVAVGDSAGGQMAASLSMYMRDHSMPALAGQVLIYPVLGTDLSTASYVRNAEAPCLTRDEMIYYWNSVLGPEGNANWSDKYIIPLLERDYRNLPPAFITAAGHDPLYDDAIDYAARLRQAGVAVRFRGEPSLAHSYMRARHVSKPAMQGFKAIVNAVRFLGHEAKLP